MGNIFLEVESFDVCEMFAIRAALYSMWPSRRRAIAFLIQQDHSFLRLTLHKVKTTKWTTANWKLDVIGSTIYR